MKHLKESTTAVKISNSYFYWGISRKISKPKNDDDKPNQITKFEDLMTLKGINFEAKKGEFIAVIGGVGAGKSSFVKAISGSLQYVDEKSFEKFKNKVIPDNSIVEREKAIIEINLELLKQRSSLKEKPILINGSSCYVEQVPLVQYLSIQDNILFGS